MKDLELMDRLETKANTNVLTDIAAKWAEDRSEEFLKVCKAIDPSFFLFLQSSLINAEEITIELRDLYVYMVSCLPVEEMYKLRINTKTYLLLAENLTKDDATFLWQNLSESQKTVLRFYEKNTNVMFAEDERETEIMQKQNITFSIV